MKYALTCCPVHPRTRKRIGKSRVVIVDTAFGKFAGLKTPKEVEEAYEKACHELGQPVKVVDVREAIVHTDPL